MSNDLISQFADALTAAGYVPVKQIVADDKWHPCYINGEKKPHGAYSMKIIDGSFAIGCFFDRRDEDKKTKWHSKSEEKPSPEELKRRKKEQEAADKAREQAERRKQERLSARLMRVYKKLVKADKHPYLENKGILPHGIKHRAKGNELVIAGYGIDGKIWTLQRILPAGNKFLFTGGRKRASYFPFAFAGEDLSSILLCEGFATGASIRQATGLPVIACFDAGNMKAVAIDLKKKYPSSRFVFCADNDAFTFDPKKKPDGIMPKEVSGEDPRWQEWRDAGLLWNVGIEKAKQAAVAIGGAAVIWPEFVSHETKPTDFNDLHALLGLDAVKERILPVLPSASSDGAGEGADNPSDVSDQPPSPVSIDPEDMSGYEQVPHGFGDLPVGDFGMRFRVLGYNNGQYYYFPYKARQIVSLSASAHSINNLLQLEDLDSWLQQFSGGGENVSEKKIALYSANALIQLATARGVFQEENTVRGCGAWLDAGRVVLHCGDRLFVDGVEMAFDKLDTEYVYVAAAKMLRPALDNPLSNAEAYQLRQICEAITWEKKVSGALLAGWLVIAPICAALDHRPHLDLTGEADSGKSTVADQIVKRVLGKISLNVDGKTTEPSVREQMRYDARPLIFDEAEKSDSIQAVRDLARLASSGGVVRKFGQRPFNARFCAMFIAINPTAHTAADESRTSFLVIKKNRRPTALQEYEALLAQIENVLTPDFSNRLLARTISNMPALLKNIKTFIRAARKTIGVPRAAKQIGTMLAGLYMLHSTGEISEEKAIEWLKQYSWKSHTVSDEDTDPQRLLRHLSVSMIKVQNSHGTKEYTVGDLIVIVNSEGDNCPEAKALRYHGIAVKNGRVIFSSSHDNLAKLLRGTDWDKKWSRALGDIEGSEAVSSFYFSSGFKGSAVALPVDLFTDKGEPVQQQFKSFDPTQEIPF